MTMCFETSPIRFAMLAAIALGGQLACSSDGTSVAHGEGGAAPGTDRDPSSDATGGSSTGPCDTGAGAGGQTGAGGRTGGVGGSSSEDFPAPPNDLDPGDGTLATGGSLVFGAKNYGTVGSTTGCSQQASTNRFVFVLSNFNEPFKVFTVRITVPQDSLDSSRVFPVGPHPADHDFTGLDYASIRTFPPDGTTGAALDGEVWVQLEEGVPTVRTEGVLVTSDDAPKGAAEPLSVALLCDEAVEQ